jgi:cytochrome c-type biogenesis protein CcmE
VAFKLVDNGGHLVTVEFDGILPDLFREGQGIVAQGTLKDATTVAAFEVLAKHDENYMPPEVADATNGMHFKPEYTEAQLQEPSNDAGMRQIHFFIPPNRQVSPCNREE